MPKIPVIETSERQNFFCKIYIDGNKLNPSNIISCTIREWVFELLPRLELSILDDGVLFEGYPLNDTSIIEIEIAKDKEQNVILNTRFDVIDFSLDIISDNKFSVVNITGLLETKNLFFPIKNRSFSNTSKNVLNDLCNEINLSFESDIDTSDKMIWIQSNISNYDMIHHVLKRTRKVDDATFFYSNINSKMKLTSLNVNINKSNFISAKYDLDNYSKSEFDDPIDDNTVWFNSYDSLNTNGYFNRVNNYGIQIGYYNLEKRLTEKIANNSNLITDNTFQSYSGDMVRFKNFGILTKNVYDKYYQTIVNNEYYKKNFFANSLVLSINSRTNISLFDKLNVLVPSLIDSQFNDVLSGEYLVGGIMHNISKNNIYKKNLVLFRNGYNTPTTIERKNI